MSAPSAQTIGQKRKRYLLEAGRNARHCSGAQWARLKTINSANESNLRNRAVRTFASTGLGLGAIVLPYLGRELRALHATCLSIEYAVGLRPCPYQLRRMLATDPFAQPRLDLR